MVLVCLPSDAPSATLILLLGLLLPWTWGISSRLLQQSTATAPYLGGGISPPGRPFWPWTWSSSSWPSCDRVAATPWTRGLLLSTAAPDLGCGVILKDDAVKGLHSVCQQIWKAQQWPQDWKRSVFSPIPKKGNAKECSNYHTIAFISHASK